MDMLLKFREIEVLWAVYKAGSINGAASLLNITQPAVSMTLKAAEERFGFLLFDREGGRAYPTPEALALIQPTSGIFLELKEFERQLMRVREGRAGVLRIAATPTLDVAFIHQAIGEFSKREPGARVHVRTVPTDLVEQLVADDQVDFGIAYGPVGNEATLVEDLLSAEIGCLFHRNHALTELELVRPSDLMNERLLTYRPDTPLGRMFDKVLKTAGTAIEPTMETTALAAAHLASIGIGIALIDPVILRSELFPDLVARPFEPTVATHVQLLSTRHKPLSLIARAFLDALRETIAARLK